MVVAIERVVRKLSRQQQTIFRLRHYEDMSFERIAELLQLNPGTVRAHLFRAIRNLRRELKELEPRGARTK
jgi:RNA polymerase sigma-70 factor (ECF subfamily)